MVDTEMANKREKGHAYWKAVAEGTMTWDEAAASGAHQRMPQAKTQSNWKAVANGTMTWAADRTH